MDPETKDYIRQETIRYLKGERKEMFSYYTINGHNIPAHPDRFGEIADELFLDQKHPLFLTVLVSIAERQAKASVKPIAKE
ncbi:MAG TPA: hypothetical protein VJI46_02710 [Candidatus Nanoarchaeia archaeon]|nr:hypothetical protein [Candidatus Nanoarchaeia archaeon]